MRFVSLLLLSFCVSAWAVPLEMIYTGQVTDASGNPIANLDAGAPASGVGGIRVTFWSSAWNGGMAPQTPPGTQRNVTLLAAAGGTALSVPGTFVTSCTPPGGSFSFASCQAVTMNANGIFSTSLHLSLAGFDTLFPDGSSSSYIQLERVFVDINTGVVTPVQYYPRQRYAAAPYCLKVPIDNTALTYAGGQLTLAASLADTRLATITSAGKVSGSAISGTIANGTAIDTSGNINTTGSLTVDGVSVPTGAGFNGYVPVWTGVTSLDSSPLYVSGADVGVGRTSPQAKLDVNGALRVANTSATCTAANAGSIKWTGSGFYGCDGTVWSLIQGRVKSGATKANAGESCQQILGDGFSTGDGAYWIDIDGGSTGNAMRLYCDMTSDDGGWTLVHKTDQSSWSDLNTNQFNVSALQSPTINALATLSRPHLNAIGTTWRVLFPDGTKFYWTWDEGFMSMVDDFTASGSNVRIRLNWTDPWEPGGLVFSGATHGTCISRAGYYTDASVGHHICVKRWCCGGSPGIWRNFGGWSPGSYSPATMWVK